MSAIEGVSDTVPEITLNMSVKEFTPVTDKRLLFVTGTRADYGKLEPLAHAAQQAGFQITFFITGMHMMKRYGQTRLEVERFPNAEFFEFVNQREGDAQDFILSKTILGFSDFVHEHRPDLVIIHGDRVEALAASLVCAMRYILSAHIEGGEVSGTIDESLRHCNTKLCASHFVSNDVARSRVLALGEPAERIYTIGSPELDSHARPSGVDIDAVKQRYDISFDDYGIVIFHPVTSEQNTMAQQAQALFAALEASQKHFVVIAPNNDPGTEGIFAVIKQLPSERFRVIPSMRFKYFSELMKNARVMVGNSSAGVREAPFLGLPSLDVGSRQHQRTNAKGVYWCHAQDTDAILGFLEVNWALGERKADTAFGLGNASAAFVKVLQQADFWHQPIQKTFVTT